MPAIETKAQLEKIKAALKDMQTSKLGVEKANKAVTDKAAILGNLIGMASRDPLKLEEEVKRLVADAFMAGVHEKEE